MFAFAVGLRLRAARRCSPFGATILLRTSAPTHSKTAPNQCFLFASAVAMRRRSTLLAVLALCCLARACAAFRPTNLGDDELSDLACVMSQCAISIHGFYFC